MHHALGIDEILVNIIAHCNFLRFRYHVRLGIGSDLVALACTCHLFKEPALDELWWELPDLCPLARCLPDISYQMNREFIRCYSFKRPLEEAEWNTLRSYTRRIRSILDFAGGFQPDQVRIFLNPSVSHLLFPNLRHLRNVFPYGLGTAHLLRQPLPSLISIEYSYYLNGVDLSLFRESLEPFPGFSPSLRKFSISLSRPELIDHKLVSDFICRWSNPQTVLCPQISLDMNAITHLSRTPGLTQLSFAPSATLSDSPSDALLFSALYKLKLFSDSLTPIFKLLAYLQLPAVKDFVVEINNTPSRQSFTSFLAALQQSGVSDSITRLRLFQFQHSPENTRSAPVLAVGDLRPSMAHRNLRHIDLNLRWNVCLTDSDLLTLASAWPYLEQLFINDDWGWQTSGGITPDGLVRLLQTCPSLSRLALAIDTRDYIKIPRARSPASLGLTLFPSFFINVVDSVIDTASVPAMAAFFANIVSSTRFTLGAWGRRLNNLYADRWTDVSSRAGKAVAHRSVIPG